MVRMQPDHVAVRLPAGGGALSFAELDALSLQLAAAAPAAFSGAPAGMTRTPGPDHRGRETEALSTLLTATGHGPDTASGTAGQNLIFVLRVIQAWREDAVLQPVDSGHGAGALLFFPDRDPDTGTDSASGVVNGAGARAAAGAGKVSGGPGAGSSRLPHGSPAVSSWPAAVCHLKTTSGSTGTPRHVLFTAAQLAADADQIAATMGLQPAWPNIAAISLAHSYGFSNLVLPLLLHGIPLVLPESPLPAAMRRTLEGGSDFTLPAVPALWRAWLAAGVLDGGRIRLAISAGAPLPLELEQAVFARTGLKIHNFYGSSECGGIAYDRTSLPRQDARLAGTAMEGVCLSTDPASGCLRVRSAAAGTGYWQEDPSLGNGSFLTTDHVSLGESGEVLLEGRASDAINIAGRKIPPSLLEEKLLALPGVRHCVVFGVPSADPARVEEIAAVLHLEDGVCLAEIRQASARHLAAADQPRHWRSTPELVPDHRGKISRHFWRSRWPMA